MSSSTVSHSMLLAPGAREALSTARSRTVLPTPETAIAVVDALFDAVPGGGDVQLARKAAVKPTSASRRVINLMCGWSGNVGMPLRLTCTVLGWSPVRKLARLGEQIGLWA